jgi:type IV pilus assembly protein PilW
MNEPRRHRQSGLGLVELLVAIGLGLFLVSAAATLFLAQMAEQRRMLLATRLTQDLRAAADLAVQDLRRAGYRGDAEGGVWQADSEPTPNPYTVIYPNAGGSDSAVGYSYSRDAEDHLVTSNERFGLRLNSSSRTLDLRLSGAAIAPGSGDNWQALTDPKQIVVTRVLVRHDDQSMSLLTRCQATSCPTGSTDCPPLLHRHLLTLEIDARSAIDPSIRRNLQSRVRVRNDHVSGRCPPG